MLYRVLGPLLLVAAATAQPIEIVNEHGGIAVEVVADNRFQVWRAGSPGNSSEGIVVSRSPARLLVEALPPEDESPDIALRVPVGLPFSLKTAGGDISLSGMLRRVQVQSLTGSLSIAAPLGITLLNLEATQRPSVIDLPPSRSLGLVPLQIGPRLRIWKLTGKLRSRDLAYGQIDAQLHSPTMLRIRDWQIPADWPLKPHSMSNVAVDRLLAKVQRRQGGKPSPPAPRGEAPVQAVESESEVLFSSEVRMVNMSVAVSDSMGRPLIGLGRDDFLVEEQGVRQDIRVADPEESPFNLAVLLDLSGSTAVDLDHMRRATTRLIEMARPNDRVALYAMSGSMFHRLTAFTSDRDLLMKRVNSLPYPVGGSPLWDVIALAYDEELADLAGERNALIVISDGIDNRISGQSVPSNLRAARLIQAAGEMEARIYPIFLLSGERFGRNWSSTAHNRMELLAKKTGGRLFTARSVADIEPVLPELASELRSVYEIAYYPANQEFDGTWRRVRINVAGRDAKVRARPGYFAQ